MFNVLPAVFLTANDKLVSAVFSTTNPPVGVSILPLILKPALLLVKSNCFVALSLVLLQKYFITL